MLDMTDDTLPHDPSTGWSDDLTCPQCQLGELTSRHCTALCELCGYIESCEDLFPLCHRAMPELTVGSGTH